MKTTIIIKGQPNSIRTLRNAIMTNDCDEIKVMNHIELDFRSKKDAIKALSIAYQYLKSDKEDWDNSCGSYEYASGLGYDAGNARILPF